MLKIMHVVGARPNFPKVAPIMAEMANRPDQFEQLLVHTGQHYDYNLSQVFFDDLEMSEPDEFLNVGSGTHAVQTASVMTAFEPVVLQHRPDWVIVFGDVNSTLGCALVCSKMKTRVAHVEAGLRSGDRTMPEEINRILTDHISDLLFTPSSDANDNLLREGVGLDKIHFVGNVMIDTLAKLLPKALQRCTLSSLGLKPKNYILVTLHRPANVDDPVTLKQILTALAKLSQSWQVIFPVHPRTRRRIECTDMACRSSKIRLIDPLGYLDFLALMNSASLVMTDSGGVQEETTYLGVRCLTLRPNTERPVTIESGTNRLSASNREAIIIAVQNIMHEDLKKCRLPDLWDGSAAKRIVRVLG
jgi:UDP-N-acetylglucosamine 2-epimerase (non-hydrolysing)